jgi:hypothetical protein
MRINSRHLTLTALVAGLQAATAGDITGTITLSGTPPEEKVNQMIADDVNCGKLHTEPVKTQFYVVGSNQGLKDVVVYINNVKGKSTGESAPPVVLDQKNCEYAPYIFAVQTGQKISVRDSDPAPISHNIHPIPNAAGNKEVNFTQIAGQPDLTLTFPSAEDFLKISCNVHVWMLAYVTVVDNPYYAVTDKNGAFKLANVPPGKYTVQIMHRKANGGKPVIKEVEVKDGNVTLDATLEVPK